MTFRMALINFKEITYNRVYVNLLKWSTMGITRPPNVKSETILSKDQRIKITGIIQYRKNHTFYHTISPILGIK